MSKSRRCNLMLSRNKMVLLEYICTIIFYPTIIWNFIFDKVATKLDEEYFIALIGFTWCHKASVQIFCFGGVTWMTWTHFKYYSNIHHISTTKTLLAYILGSKVSNVHVHDSM